MEKIYISPKCKLGEGSHGSIFKCIDVDGNEYAVKCVKCSEYGIAGIFEAIVMSNVVHPALNRCIAVHVSPSMLYMVQEKAINNVKQYIKMNEVSYEKKCEWRDSIINGLMHLHGNGIIHGDIKASNILVYGDTTIKLSDYSHSTHIKFRNMYRPGTPTHRAPEAWPVFGKWYKEIDLWSLGCTLIEIYYKHNLFPYQGYSESLNAISDWAKFGPYHQKLNIVKCNVPYKSFNNILELKKKGETNNLICNLLRIDPSERCVSYNQPLYNDKKINNPIYCVSLANNIVDTIMSKLRGIQYMDEVMKHKTCMYITYKIIYNNSNIKPDLERPNEDILKYELMICNSLGFNFFDFRDL